MTNASGGPPKGRTDRLHERYEVDWRVSLKCPDWRFVGKVAAANASRGGLFLLTTRPPVVGTPVELTVQLPDGQTLPLRGKVVHVVTPEMAAAQGRSAGIGVKIDEKHAGDLLLLEHMAQEDAEHPAPPPSQMSAGASLPPLSTASSPPVAAAPAAPAPAPAPAKAALPSGKIASAVGIDFGTTFTSITVAIGDEVHLIADDQGRTLQPSIVHYPERGNPIVGWPARERLALEPRRTIASVKRLLGHPFSDPTIAGYLQSASYKTLGGPNDSILIDVDGNQVAVPQVCAAVLTHVRDLAEKQLKTTVRQVTMSIPVTHTESQKAALRRAAQLAGLEVIGFVSEPVAGALAYGLGQGKNEIVAVYDFGGGTFDFTVMDMSGDNYRVLASEGDSWLGGDDFDLVLAQAVADAFWRATKIELRQRIVEWQRLLMACEAAKRGLSTDPAAYIVVDNLVEAPKRVDLRQKVERPLFERLCKELFDRSIAVCREALGRAGLEPTDVTQLVVTGGVSRIPFVRAGLSQVFEREILSVVSPEEAIALGAGLVAAKTVKHPVKAVARRG